MPASRPASPPAPSAPNPAHAPLHAARLGVIASAVLMTLQLATGWLTGSHAIVADGTHTLVDLLVDALLFASVGPRARQRMAALGAWACRLPAAVGMTLPIVAGSAFLVEGIADTPAAAQTLAAAAPATTPAWALLSAVLIVVIREYTARRLHRAAQTVGGDDALTAGALTAGAWHARIDALSACAAAAGATGTLAGLGGGVDQIATMLIGAIMIGTGVLPKGSPVRECVRRCHAQVVRLRSAR